ncbi:MAG: ABC transporter ATP-binding protein [Eubacteriales bacterium]|nr:ABC transporter ATP-binding protein [Eubacteriales bacterium]
MSEIIPAIEFKGITKRFGGFTANDHIDLKIYPGEVHALLGENGAGKTTLMNILYGLYKADEGQIFMNGKPLQIHSPQDAIRAGIGMVHQHYMLVDIYSAAENVFLLGNDPWYRCNRGKKIENELQKVAEEYGLEVDVHSPVEKLSISTQQRVEILKLLYIGAEVLVLDEPTSFSTPQEVESLFETIEKLIKHGKSVIFISHKLEEVLRISNRITVLSLGKVCGQMQTCDADKQKIVEMMIGENIAPPSFEHEAFAAGREELMRVENLFARDDRNAKSLNGVSFTLNRGEIIGIAALEGNGQNELAEVISGLRKAEQGEVLVNGKKMDTSSAVDFIHENVACVPADRLEVGTVKDDPLFQNWILREERPPMKGKILDYKKICCETEEALEEYDVRSTGLKARAGNLSGGNMQKFILARELHKKPEILICSFPTRGLDIKATWFIREMIQKSRDKGMGVVLFSGEMEELFSLSDRILVMHKGKLVGELRPKEYNAFEIGRLMMGVNV